MKNRNAIFYAVIVTAFSLLMWYTFTEGAKLEQPNVAAVENEYDNSISSFQIFISEFLHNIQHPLALLILQIAIIMVVARIFGYLANRIGQPSVVGEILAGIVLGPSLLGLVFPGIYDSLFPVASLGNLQFLSQIGLILFMFIIGMELDVKVLKNKAHAAVVISHASIIFPYFLGVSLAFYLYSSYAPEGVSFLVFGLFMGIAMSITAFPVLARIVQERGLTKTHLGTMAITCAAADDITAWCILAAVIAIVKAGTFLSALYTMLLAALYVIFMIYAVRPFLIRVGMKYASRETLNKSIIAFIFFVLLISSYLTEIIGIHALFGAFMAGSIMPNNLNFKKLLSEKIEDISLVLLLPLFFAFTGLRTEIGLLNDWNAWLVCFSVIAIATLGKFGGSTFAARFVGQSWKDSLSIGALMNTRGLMELVVLNIGYELGVLSPEIFVMMVLMALLTTFMTGPSLAFIDWSFTRSKALGERVIDGISATMQILISFANPKSGSTLLRLARDLTFRFNSEAKYTALHITPSSDINPLDAVIYEKESFKPIRMIAQQENIPLHTMYKNTNDVEKEIQKALLDKNYDLILFGAAIPLFTEDKTGGILERFIEQKENNVAVLIDKGYHIPKKILFIVFNYADKVLLDYTDRFIENHEACVDIISFGDEEISLLTFQNLEKGKYNFIQGDHKHLAGIKRLDNSFVNQYDLVIVKLETWKMLTRKINVQNFPSTLIIKYNKDLPLSLRFKRGNNVSVKKDKEEN